VHQIHVSTYLRTRSTRNNLCFTGYLHPAHTPPRTRKQDAAGENPSFDAVKSTDWRKTCHVCAFNTTSRDCCESRPAATTDTDPGLAQGTLIPTYEERAPAVLASLKPPSSAQRPAPPAGTVQRSVCSLQQNCPFCLTTQSTLTAHFTITTSWSAANLALTTALTVYMEPHKTKLPQWRDCLPVSSLLSTNQHVLVEQRSARHPKWTVGRIRVNLAHHLRLPHLSDILVNKPAGRPKAPRSAGLVF
jgi:hypothetical protein